MAERLQAGMSNGMTEQQPTFSSDLAVVYLARFAEGPKPMAAFVSSCKQNDAGIGHDLIVIRKGFPPGKSAQDNVVSAFFPHAIAVSDDGFDITAYAVAAAQLPHKYVVFLNTFSEIVANNWLRKLRAAFDDPAVGIAGATGSYESLHTSMRRFRLGMFLTQKQLPVQAGLRRIFRFVRQQLPQQLAKRLVAKVISYFAVRATRPHMDALSNSAFEAYWAGEIAPGGTYDFLRTIPLFPNPHIRSNAFMIERQLFLDALPPVMLTKQDSYNFESGPDGLTQQALRRGKNVVIVGADGRTFGIDKWSASGTFRQGDQGNLLVHDNQTRGFEQLTSAEKRAFAEMSWGEN